MRYTDTDLLVSVFSTVLSINSKYCKYLAFFLYKQNPSAL